MTSQSVLAPLLLVIAVVFFHAISPRFRPGYLLGLSYAFYALQGWLPFCILLALTLATYWLCLRLADFGGRTDTAHTARAEASTLGLALLLPLGTLALFKYLPPLAQNSGVGLWVARVGAPLGLSYYTFRLVSYILDVYWGRAPAERDLGRLALSVAFFPQIVSGPIQRPADFLEQLRRAAPVPAATVRSGLRLILFGLFKKLVVADPLEKPIDAVFTHPQEWHSAAILVAVYAFAIQLYADFSGITDIALGVGRLVGIKGPPNFDNPFYAPNIQAFWRRWHMSLTSWLGTYVFVPLRMQLRGLGKVGLALAIGANLVAVGLWHKGSWNFAIFGALNGVYMIVSVFTLRRRDQLFEGRPLASAVRSVVGPLLTFHLVAMTLVFARAQTVGDASYILRHVVPSSVKELSVYVLRLGTLNMAAIAVMEAVHLLHRDGRLSRVVDWLPVWARWSGYYAVTIAIIWRAFQEGQEHAFLYAQF
jgi:D-alanyl-lipoteichoic acid acyltransferase DltB (MBOAT superfamily)